MRSYAYNPFGDYLRVDLERYWQVYPHGAVAVRNPASMVEIYNRGVKPRERKFDL